MADDYKILQRKLKLAQTRGETRDAFRDYVQKQDTGKEPDPMAIMHASKEYKEKCDKAKQKTGCAHECLCFECPDIQDCTKGKMCEMF